MKLGMHVRLGPGHFVLDGDPAPLPKGHSPQFLAHIRCGQMAAWIKMPLGMEEGLGPGDSVFDGANAVSKLTKKKKLTTTVIHILLLMKLLSTDC